MDAQINCSKPVVSIIIPVYNASSLIKRCLDSILAQDSCIAYEVLLIDDGCTDDSVNIIKSYDNNRFKIFRQVNAGPAAARNKGIKEAVGKFITFIDADDYWEPSFLKTTIDYLEQNPNVIAVNTGQKHLTVSGSHISPSCINEIKDSCIINDFFSFWAKYHHVCTGSVLIRSEVVKDIGYQRVELRAGEDWEFWMMIATYGKWGFIPKVLFVSDGSKVTRDIGWIEKMMPRWKNAPEVSFWEERLLTRLQRPLPNGYKKCIGYVAQDIILSQLLSKRYKLSYNEVHKYMSYFPKNSMSKLFKICSHSYCTWVIMSKLLLFREYHRKL